MQKRNNGVRRIPGAGLGNAPEAHIQLAFLNQPRELLSSGIEQSNAGRTDYRGIPNGFGPYVGGNQWPRENGS